MYTKSHIGSRSIKIEWSKIQLVIFLIVEQKLKSTFFELLDLDRTVNH